jgi:hypothetical protein
MASGKEDIYWEVRIFRQLRPVNHTDKNGISYCNILFIYLFIETALKSFVTYQTSCPPGYEHQNLSQK